MTMTMRVKASSTIKPAAPTPKHRLWLSDLDLIMPSTHATIIYFYKPNNPNTTTSFFSPDIMKNSLSQTLVHFYPLAGRLHYDESGRLEIDCNEAGVIFYEAESDVEIDDFGDFKITPELRDLAPHVDYTTRITEWPLMLLQLTVFRCGGVSLGFATSHTAMDGPSAAHFFCTWAKIACTGKADICMPPCLDRTLLRVRDPSVKPVFKHEEFKPPPRLDHGGERRKETTVEMFKLTYQQVNAMREAANMGRSSATGPRFSRYESIAAHIWRSTCKARGLEDDQMTELQIAVQGRTRLQPPLPVDFIGNVVFRATVVARSGDLVTGPVGHVAGRIKEVLEKMKDKYLRSTLDFLNGQEDLTPLRSGAHTLGCTQGKFYGCPNMVLTSWLGMPFYDADFGWGPPMYMGPATLVNDGKGFIIPAKKEDDGGVIIALCLQTKHMEALKELLLSKDDHGLSWFGHEP
ncbi:spermidine hydroxycinnamoyl transferase [Cinnamomum micranthum f. kanehirae]|uniref:Spermidine hydroxycinnamoyl transferase n=1 Tax=Cinnamomum micranthum f. kanehirae TaxID=337451 RepID=A0A3S3LVN3_9MAGN|nr:spermidine hydroxycinnamoyl transferase [Cinnamomum micranthum f. kanehirae]